MAMLTRWYDSCDLLIWILWGLWASGIRSPGRSRNGTKVTVPGIIGTKNGTRWHQPAQIAISRSQKHQETISGKGWKRVNKKKWTWVLLDTVSVLLLIYHLLPPLLVGGKWLVWHSTKQNTKEKSFLLFPWWWQKMDAGLMTEKCRVKFASWMQTALCIQNVPEPERHSKNDSV